MISFLLEEGVLTVGTMSGLFTAAMLNSFRINILDPTIEKMYPSSKLDSPSLSTLDSASQIVMNQTDPAQHAKSIVKWQTFLRDFITWVIVMFLLYLFWKNVLKKYKKQN
jgi:large-conductance mechanosensitive channel